VFDDKAIAKSEQFNDTLTILGSAVTGVKNAIGQVFIPSSPSSPRPRPQFVVQNRALIVSWVKDGWNFLKQVVLDLIAIFKGKDADVVNTWLLTARDNLNEALRSPRPSAARSPTSPAPSACSTTRRRARRRPRRSPTTRCRRGPTA
jgi:hypothetical protein